MAICIPGARPFLATLGALLLLGCQGGTPKYQPSGAVTPTVAGSPAPAFANYDQAREAFTRASTNNVVIATLKDSAWLRFSGDPSAAMTRHRDYFDYGYTAFEITLRTPDNVKAAEETFVLEDSNGTRQVGKPLRYESEMTLVEDRFQYTFDLAFRHSLTKDIRWIRLTREEDGEVVQWEFPAGR